jgi:hypothetical protein
MAMRNDSMPRELVELEERLCARHGGGSEMPRGDVMRVVGEELERAPRGSWGGWGWAAVGVAVLIVLNLSAVWGMGDRYSVWGAARGDQVAAQVRMIRELETRYSPWPG